MICPEEVNKGLREFFVEIINRLAVNSLVNVKSDVIYSRLKMTLI